MARTIPERVAWAVEVLDVQPADHLLEIGCGRGVAVSLVCEKLAGGTITAIDRSEGMVDAARKANLRHVASGRATLRPAALGEAEFGEARFDKIFAVNVNLFWRGAACELSLIKTLLAPKGALYVFYQPPAAAKIRQIAATLGAVLTRYGFQIDAVRTGNRSAAPLLCVVAGLSVGRAPR